MAKTGPNKMKEWRKVKKHLNEKGEKVRIGRQVRNRMRQLTGMKFPSTQILAMMQKVNLIPTPNSDKIDSVVTDNGEPNATI